MSCTLWENLLTRGLEQPVWRTDMWQVVGTKQKIYINAPLKWYRQHTEEECKLKCIVRAENRVRGCINVLFRIELYVLTNDGIWFEKLKFEDGHCVVRWTQNTTHSIYKEINGSSRQIIKFLRVHYGDCLSVPLGQSYWRNPSFLFAGLRIAGVLERNWARYFPLASLQFCHHTYLRDGKGSLHYMHTALPRYSLFLFSVYLRMS
jgi:hypothetical protein